MGLEKGGSEEKRREEAKIKKRVELGCVTADKPNKEIMEEVLWTKKKRFAEEERQQQTVLCSYDRTPQSNPVRTVEIPAHPSPVTLK